MDLGRKVQEGRDMTKQAPEDSPTPVETDQKIGSEKNGLNLGRGNFQSRSQRKVDGNFGGAVDEVADDFVANDHDGIDQVFAGVASSEEVIYSFCAWLTTIQGDVANKACQGIHFGIKRGFSGTDFQDLLVGEAIHFADGGVSRKTILTFVDLTHDQIDDFAFFGFEAAFAVLQGQVVSQSGVAVSIGGVEVGDKTNVLFQVVKNRLVGSTDGFAGGYFKSCHNLYWLMDENKSLFSVDSTSLRRVSGEVMGGFARQMGHFSRLAIFPLEVIESSGTSLGNDAFF